MSDFFLTVSPAAASLPYTPRRPIPRKGHRKSRAGCLICKRRKVKCDEVTPKCGGCERLGIVCEYQKTKLGQEVRPSALAPSRPLYTGPAMFDKDDMRFFRHFLFEAYPSLPIDGFITWQQVTALAHEARQGAWYIYDKCTY